MLAHSPQASKCEQLSIVYMIFFFSIPVVFGKIRSIFCFTFLHSVVFERFASLDFGQKSVAMLPTNGFDKLALTIDLDDL